MHSRFLPLVFGLLAWSGPVPQARAVPLAPGAGTTAWAAAPTAREVAKGAWLWVYLRPSPAGAETAEPELACEEFPLLDDLTPAFTSCREDAGSAGVGEVPTPNPFERVCFPPPAAGPGSMTQGLSTPGSTPDGPAPAGSPLAASGDRIAPPAFQHLAREGGPDSWTSPCSRLFRPPRVRAAS